MSAALAHSNRPMCVRSRPGHAAAGGAEAGERGRLARWFWRHAKTGFWISMNDIRGAFAHRNKFAVAWRHRQRA